MKNSSLSFIKAFFASIFFAAHFYFSVFAEQKLPNFYDDVPDKELALSIIEKMTDEELLAQTFMFGWTGREPDKLAVKWVEESGLGSIKIFGRNTGDSRKLAEAVLLLQKKAAERRFGIPLFVATDQEGGWVRHVKGLTLETPGNLAIGASGYPQDAYYAGYYISKELGTLGINLNFAPAVDLYTDPSSTIIGPRSFGDSPEAAGILGAAFFEGSKAAGVLTTAKHFPGHGDTAVDSHGRLPEIAISEKTLRTRELVPFKRLIDTGIPFIMPGHLNFPRILQGGEPATFSKYLLNDVLRKELKFKGLVITDDMMMHGAISYAGGIAEAVRMALEAGNDIVESSITPRHSQPFWQDNLKRMRENPEFKKRIKDAVFRILSAKLGYFKGANHVPVFPDPEKVHTELSDKEAQTFFLNLAARSATVIRGEYIPFVPRSEEKILLVANYREFFKAGLKRFPEAKIIEINLALSQVRRFDTVIFCLSDNYSASVLQNLIRKYPQKKYIVISALSPVHLTKVPEIKTAIAVYSYSPPSFTAAFAVLCGDFKAAGKMPISGIE